MNAIEHIIVWLRDGLVWLGHDGYIGMTCLPESCFVDMLEC